MLANPLTATDALAGTLADLVVAALIDEATLTPKPGLVDMRSRGAHQDMSWSLMCDSALALRPTFHAMALAGMQNHEPRHLREAIGALGRAGEVWMMQVTGGVNTHRGAIWALGLLVTAAASDCLDGIPADVASVAARAATLAQIDDRYAPALTGNKGELARQRYRVGGARAQAQQGFPLVLHHALPALASSRRRGDPESAARLNGLLSVMAVLDDTCVLARGGWQALHAVQRGAQRVLDLGGVSNAAGDIARQVLERDLLRWNVSPGGSADLLAAALFLERLEHLVKQPALQHPMLRSVDLVF